jgi:hypothetical protein
MEPTDIFDTQNRCRIALCSSTRTSALHLNPPAQMFLKYSILTDPRWPLNLKGPLKVKYDRWFGWPIYDFLLVSNSNHESLCDASVWMNDTDFQKIQDGDRPPSWIVRRDGCIVFDHEYYHSKFEPSGLNHSSDIQYWPSIQTECWTWKVISRSNLIHDLDVPYMTFYQCPKVTLGLYVTVWAQDALIFRNVMQKLEIEKRSHFVITT